MTWRGCRCVWHARTMPVSRLLTVVRRGSCGPTRKLIFLRTQSLVLCSKYEMRRSFLRHLVSKAWILFFFSSSRVGKEGTYFTVLDEDDGDKRLIELDLACEADGVAPRDSVSSGHCCRCWSHRHADLCWAGAIFGRDCSQVLETGHLLQLHYFFILIFFMWVKSAICSLCQMLISYLW